MRTIPIIFVCLLALLALPLRAAPAAEAKSVRAILISATNLKREADPKLAAYEAELQRNIPLSSFRYVGEGAASVAAGRPTPLNLPRGNRLVLEAEKGGGKETRLKVQWVSGKDVFFNITLTVESGSTATAVLGRRPSGDGETPIVLVIAK